MNCTSPGSDAFVYLGVRWNDVNKFQNAGTFTFSIWSESNASSINVQLLLIRNCGAGGSTPSPILLDTYALSTGWGQFTTSFTFPSNAALTIGKGSYVELAISFPGNVTFDCSFTNAILMAGMVSNPLLNTTTSEQQLLSLPESLPIPDTQGMDLYLPWVNTPGGATYDDSSIGSLMQSLSSTAPVSWLPMDGMTQYDPNTWSSDGIPYSRLFNKILWNSTLRVSIGGTGPTFATALPLISDTTTLLMSTNNAAAQSVATDGISPTGFTFNPANTPFIAGNATYNLLSSPWHSTGFFVYCLSTGTGAQATVDSGPHPTGFTFFSETTSTDSTPRQLTYISGVGAGSTLKVGSGTAKYFLTANTTTKFYVWYQVDGVGNDPAVASSTGIKVNLLSAYTSADVVLATSRAISGYSQNFITFLAGSSVPASSYFNLPTTKGTAVVWYKVNGSGTAPAGSILIEVDIFTTDGAMTVASKTQAAINSKYYVIPSSYGAFLRGNDPSSLFDIDATGRWTYNGILSGANPGTYELGQNQSHEHNFIVQPGTQEMITIGLGVQGVQGGSTFFINYPAPPTLASGDQEAIPFNLSVNYFIKY